MEVQESKVTDLNATVGVQVVSGGDQKRSQRRRVLGLNEKNRLVTVISQ